MGQYSASVFAAVLALLLILILGTAVRDLRVSRDELQTRLDALESRVNGLSAAMPTTSPELTPCTPPLQPTPLPSTAADQMNLAKPGIDLAVYTPNISWPLFTNLNGGATVYPALKADGTVVAPHVIVDTVFFKTYRGLRNLSAWYEAVDQMNAAVCDPDTICAHGSLVFCQCVCEAGWEGTLCNVHNCNNLGDWDAAAGQCTCNDAARNATAFCLIPLCPEGQGTYNNIDNTCDCLPAWEGASCSTPADTCNDRCVGGECVSGECRCFSNNFGADCQYNCADPIPDIDRCPFRTNWGVDMPCVVDLETGEKVCVCGGGFSLTAAETIVHQLRCGPNVSLADCSAQFTLDAPTCCIPGSKCGSSFGLCASDACCAQEGAYNNRSSCLGAGCALCAGECVLTGEGECVLPGYTAARFFDDLDTPAAARKQWTRERYPFVADAGAAAVYRRLYSVCLYDLYLDYECAQSVYLEVQRLAWPDLDTDGDFPANQPVYIVLNSIDTAQCADTFPAVSLSVTGDGYTRNASVTWECPGTDGTSGVIMTYAHGERGSRHTNYHVLKATPGGDVFCLVEGPVNSTMRLWVFGSVRAEDSLFWLNLREQATDYVLMDPDPFCTRWHVDGNTLRSDIDWYLHGEGPRATTGPISGGYLEFVPYSTPYPKK